MDTDLRETSDEDFSLKITVAWTMSAWMSYVVDTPTVKGSNVPPILCDPPIGMSKEDSFVMGDFWPGNIMAMLEEEMDELKRIYVVDWEITRPGLLGMEVGYFCAMHQLRRSEAVCQETASLVMGNFIERYKKICAPDNHECNRAIVHWGAHMAVSQVWGAHIPWGGKELTRQIVLEGVDLIVKAYRGDS